MVLGVLAFGVLAQKISGVNFPIAWWLCMSLSVWVVYISDHLLDSHRTQKTDLILKYHFFRVNFNALIYLVGLAAVSALQIAYFYLPLSIFLYGLATSFLCTMYLIYSYLFKKYWIPKELLIAIIYAWAIWYVPLLTGNEKMKMIFFMVLTALLAFENLLLITFFENTQDRNMHVHNILQVFSNQHKFIKIVHIGISIFFMIMLVICFLVFDNSSLSATVLLCSIHIGYLIPFWFKGYFNQQSRYGIYADGLILLTFISVILP